MTESAQTHTSPRHFAIKGPVRVRIAPSPTGDPHVGTAYMALFNRAMADKFGGQFLFRLDDTDQARRNEESERQIYEALDWLGIKRDEGPDVGGPCAPYRQSERLTIYHRYVEKLLSEGSAYRCFATPDELEIMRKVQQREGRPPAYDRRWRDRPDKDVQEKLAAHAPFVVRLKMPLEGEVVFEDMLRGPIAFPAADLDDKVILKADGFPTYHLANVVDDLEFGTTHIIRGEEWLSSVPLHVVLAKALGTKLPMLLHLPLLRNADKSKVSKRKNPTSLIWFKEAGFLPEGVKNFLGLMSYSLPGDKEIFSYDEFVAQFDPARISTGGPVFDLKKLEWLNGEHVRRLSDDELEQRLIAHVTFVLSRAEHIKPLPADDPTRELGTFVDGFRLATQDRNLRIVREGARWLAERAKLKPLMPLVRERIHTLSEAADYIWSFFDALPPLPLADMDEIKKVSTEEKTAMLEAISETLRTCDFTLEATQDAMRKLVEARGWKVGPVFMLARLAALRARISPPLFESMLVLGRECTLARVDDALRIWKARAQ